ncbi:hypothetical protein D918_01604 [Trichuris suis]|nr:hypothetical protein D918_01604 [Trichuris suis]
MVTSNTTCPGAPPATQKDTDHDILVPADYRSARKKYYFFYGDVKQRVLVRHPRHKRTQAMIFSQQNISLQGRNTISSMVTSNTTCLDAPPAAEENTDDDIFPTGYQSAPEEYYFFYGDVNRSVPWYATCDRRFETPLKPRHFYNERLCKYINGILLATVQKNESKQWTATDECNSKRIR